MSRELTDAEALAHYRDELNRTRKALKDMPSPSPATTPPTIAQIEKDREREQAFNAWMESRRAERDAAARYWALADPKSSAS